MRADDPFSSESSGENEDGEPAAINGRGPDGAFFRGVANAPLVMIDYSDFLCTTCRVHAQRAEPELVEKYVDTGQLKIVFWPVLNHHPSLGVTAAADCIGEQDGDAFWTAHDLLFKKQNELWIADRAYFVEVADTVGVDTAVFAACYDSGQGHARVQALDELRLERGIYTQPIFDIGGRIVYGAQPLAVFEDYFKATGS